MSEKREIRIAAESPEAVAGLKKQYLEHTTAPLDGMWLCGFVPVADHFAFMVAGRPVGYFCVNADGYLLQFFLDQEHRHEGQRLFHSMLHRAESGVGRVRGAFVSTAEPLYLSLCLDHFAEFEVNALMYQRAPHLGPAEIQPVDLRPIVERETPDAVEFAVDAIGAPADWLRDYYGNLISRTELHGVWREGQLIALGENRLNDGIQAGCADLGVVVGKTARRQGLATRVLAQLAATNDARDLRSICSTEVHNVAAQKAITRAGFFPEHRILRFRQART